MGVKFNRIAVYCGASTGKSEVYRQAAEQLGQEMCRREIKLVYGGQFPFFKTTQHRPP